MEISKVYEELLTAEGIRLNNFTVVSHGNGVYSVSDSRSNKVILLKAKDEYEAIKGVFEWMHS